MNIDKIGMSFSVSGYRQDGKTDLGYKVTLVSEASEEIAEGALDIPRLVQNFISGNSCTELEIRLVEGSRSNSMV